MAKYLANKARRSQKESMSYTTSNEFNYSEYINAPYKSVNYINDNSYYIYNGEFFEFLDREIGNLPVFD